MNIVIYARYSCSNQREESIEGQLKVCYEFANRNNYTVIGEYIDRAISGTTDRRPEFKRMIEDSKKKQFDGVLVYQLDRFARNRYDSATNKNILKKNGVKVFSACENITDDANGILMESVLEGMAEYYSKELSQKVIRGMKVNAEKGISNGGKVPLGLYIDENKRLQIDINTAHIVKRIFEMYSSGNTMAEITRYLNEKKYKTSKGNKFGKNSLNKILTNKKYIGYYVYDNIEIKGAIPAIIDETTFNKCQEIMQKNKKAPARAKASEEYLLTTKLFCGSCNSSMVGISGYGRNKTKYCYYRCKNSAIKLCDTKTINKEYIEDIVIEETKKILTDNNINKISKEIVKLCNSTDNSNEIAYLKRLLKKKEKEMENLLTVLENGNISDIILGRINSKKDEINDIKKQIDIERLKSPSLTIEKVQKFMHSFKNGNINDITYRKSLINTFVNKVILYENRLTILYNAQYSQSNVLFNNDLVRHRGFEPPTI